MSEHEHDLIKILKHCILMPGSWDERFVRNMAGMSADHPLSPRQRETLERIAYKYRKQIIKLRNYAAAEQRKPWNEPIRETRPKRQTRVISR